jgi:Ni,Fe-hydrogenase I small subunit
MKVKCNCFATGRAQANLTHANAVMWINTANCTGCRPRVTKSQKNEILSAHSQMLGGIPTSQKVENRTM